MMKRYRAAMQGQGGIFSALRTAWASRFSAIRAFVMIPQTGDKIELHVRHSANSDDDIVTLKFTNWRTGAESILYEGSFTNGTPKRQRQLKD